MIAIDTETELTQPGEKIPRLVCVSIAIGTTADLLHHSDPKCECWLGEVLVERDIVGHYFAYDALVIGRAFPSLWPLILKAYDEDRVTDTGIRQKLLDIAAGEYKAFYEDEDGKANHVEYSLEALAKRHLGVTLDKDTWRLRYGELRDTPLEQWPEGARQYAIDDAIATLLVHGKQGETFLEDQYRQARADLWLCATSAWGLRTSGPGVEALERHLRADYEARAERLRAAGLLRPDRRKRDGTTEEGSRDTKAAKKRFAETWNFAELGPMPSTANGDISLKGMYLEASGDPLLEDYAALSKIKKQLSTDVEALKLGTVTPIHSRFEVLKETGRTGSSKPNVQNQKKSGGFRECFIPRDGYVYISADYSSLELYTWAQVCKSWLGFSTMADALNAGDDCHLRVACAIAGEPFDVKRKKALFNERQVGKVVNFGCPGGIGALKLQAYARQNYSVILTLEEATRHRATWYSTWAEARPYLKLIGKITDSPGAYIKHLYSDRIRGGVGFCDACNSPFQGLGADIAKAAGWAIFKARFDPRSPLYGCPIVNFVHDEFVLEAPEDRASEAALDLSRLMVVAALPWLPDVPTIKAEPCMMRRWSKDAEAVYRNGRLIPWEDRDAPSH